MSNSSGTLNVLVTAIEQVTPEIKRFTFKASDGRFLPAFSGGSHVVVLIPGQDKTRRNAYSLMGSPYDSSAYQIAVRRVEDGHGGSRFMHDQVKVGDSLQITPPANLFALNKHARLHLFIAGGVGITPVFSQLEELRMKDVPFELHLAVRGEEHRRLGDELQARYGSAVHLYVAPQQSLSISQVLADRPLGSHLYTCGPDSMIQDAVDSAHRLGWTDSHIHFERFVEQGSSGEAFQVTLQRQGVTLDVSPDQSMLEAVEAAGYDMPYLCRGGACGHCETDVLELEGELVHLDDWLSDEEKHQNRKIMPCVSRAKCTRLVVDL